ncbi:DNA polymerase ligase N-terminal domain-containing protein [Streptomyces sp. ATE26]|uniref:DNA polymerase ligase N-terminal domain-containing protein n=1 Tax=Streptomyces sp. ATE26 TaxID=2954237 RepID=UPI0024825688|nr:DNA polymerase ligase N-terminal domain-containing protein [Streptomyces sp. ATE26]MDI1458322.1 DNA polymerase ligase N-terminal domain-containing protein [Streptomyces sp. ATE26]
MTTEDRLRTYRGRRDFERTREPSGGAADAGERPRFVVQIHDARRMHFDFRLQVGDVLKSWSVPKGPSTDPGDRRLAVPTEDHPLEYEDFEGVIPKGEYGGGTVIVWEHGTYEPLSHDRRGRPLDFAESLERGHATFRLDGAKLHGEWALTRFRGGPDEEESWLLVRKGPARPEGHGTPDPRRARSVRTGRTLAQVAADAHAHADADADADGR